MAVKGFSDTNDNNSVNILLCEQEHRFRSCDLERGIDMGFDLEMMMMMIFILQNIGFLVNKVSRSKVTLNLLRLIQMAFSFQVPNTILLLNLF